MSELIRLRLIGVLVVALTAAASLAGGSGASSSALGLTASSTHVIVPPENLEDLAEVTFTLSEAATTRVNLYVCRNKPVEACRTNFGPLAAFQPGERTRAVLLGPGRYEVMAVDQNRQQSSNVVVVTVEDECGWLGVSGPDWAEVVPGLPYRCMASLRGEFELRSASGSTLAHAGQSRMTHGAGQVRLASGRWVPLGRMIYVKLGFEKPSKRPARLRYSVRGAQARFFFVTETQSGTVYTQGSAEVEVSHAGTLTRPARRPTRVRVIRGIAAYIPSTDARGIRVPGRCAARPTIACLGKARVGLRRATLVRAGQTRILR